LSCARLIGAVRRQTASNAPPPQPRPVDGKGKSNEGLGEGEVDALTFFLELRDFVNPRSLAMNFSSIGAMSFVASTGFPVSFARISV
jgi:hypothetical protein